MSMTETGLHLEQPALFEPAALARPVHVNRAPTVRERPKMPAPSSQCGKILAKLRSCTGAWVSMPELVACSGSYNIHSRISDLRIKFNQNIENRTDTTVTPHRSDYRITLALATLVSLLSLSLNQ